MTGPVERVPLTDEQPYEPFDQDRRLLSPPWKPTDPAVIAWEAAHGHDVRMKCYPEFGCLVIEGALERKVDRLEAELRASRAREQAQRTLREHAEHVKVELRAERNGLQQRIDRALARIDKAEPRQWRRVAVMRDIRDALTGVEAPDA